MNRRVAWALLAIAAVAVARLVADDGPPPPLALVIGGQTQDTVEPCGCGGAYAGGLARRAAVIAELRETRPALIGLDVGGFGLQDYKLPVTIRSLAAMGTDAAALSPDDLSIADQLLPLAERHALPVCSLAPPLARGITVPRRQIVGPTRGVRVGVLSVAYTTLSIHDLIKQTTAEITGLRGDGVDLVVLVSYCGLEPTRQLVAAVAEPARPELIVLASAMNEPEAPFEEGGGLWVSVARRGRSVVLVEGTPTDYGYRLAATNVSLTAGPTDATIAGWVDTMFKQLRTGELAAMTAPTPPSFPAPADCAPCHAAAVEAWRQHPHAQAVDTLEAIGRDVASCLKCHSERIRRDGVRDEPTGDRGIVCATCHGGLASHIVQGRRARTVTIDAAGCRGCHTPENSQHWDEPRYWANVLAACQGTPQPRLHPRPPAPGETPE